MKKLIIATALILSSIAGFSQAVSYEAKSVFPQSISWSADSLEVTYTYAVIVSISGDAYGFVVPDPGKNMVTFTLSAKEARSPEVLQKYAWSKAYEFVKENYPDIK